jgi:hypothetical protein
MFEIGFAFVIFFSHSTLPFPLLRLKKRKQWAVYEDSTETPWVAKLSKEK